MAIKATHAQPIKHKTISNPIEFPVTIAGKIKAGELLTAAELKEIKQQLETLPVSFKTTFGEPIFKVTYYTPFNEDGTPNKAWTWRAKTKNGLVSYLRDPHGDLPFADLTEVREKYKGVVLVKPKSSHTALYDYRLGKLADDDNSFAPVHKESVIYDLIIAFDPGFLANFSVTSPSVMVYLLDTIFNTAVEYSGWKREDWELQGSLHRNTDSFHFHFRMYQNDKTPENRLSMWFTIFSPTKWGKLKCVKKNYFVL